jgi:hypothetical protein
MKHIITFLILTLSVTIYGQKEINANLTVEGQLKVETVNELTLRPIETTKVAVFDTSNIVHYITIQELLDLADPLTLVALENTSATGTFNLDLNAFDTYELTLTGNTTLTVSNTPAVGETKVVTLGIISTTTETLTLPVGWNIYGSYGANGKRNKLTIEFINTTTGGLVVDCFINQPN